MAPITAGGLINAALYLAGLIVLRHRTTALAVFALALASVGLAAWCYAAQMGEHDVLAFGLHVVSNGLAVIGGALLLWSWFG